MLVAVMFVSTMTIERANPRGGLLRRAGDAHVHGGRRPRRGDASRPADAARGPAVGCWPRLGTGQLRRRVGSASRASPATGTTWTTASTTVAAEAEASTGLSDSRSTS